MGGVPGKGFSQWLTNCVSFARQSAINREFLLKLGTSNAIATSGLRTNLLIYYCKNPPSENSIRFSRLVGDAPEQFKSRYV